MNQIGQAMVEMVKMEDLARRDQWVNHLHPAVKLVITVIYIAFVVSFPVQDIFGLLAMAVYLVVVFNAAELSFVDCVRRLKVVLPIICAVGIANAFFDKTPVDLGFVIVRSGVISMITLMIKGSFSVFASYLLIATTGIEAICQTLRWFHIPSILVTQILLTYRYIGLLLEEAERISEAYALRAPGQKGIHFKVWGSLTGQLLLRSFDRAEEVYQSMLLRGYSGDVVSMKMIAFRLSDILWGIVWIGIFIVFRRFPVILIIGNLVGGF